MKIMIVDDNPLFRKALKFQLEKNNQHEIIAEAENGNQAFDLLDNCLPDLVLMDLVMPESDGIETTKR
ncbi:MAG: response regulator transcription factor, partial [Bacteroidota bacterium]